MTVELNLEASPVPATGDALFQTAISDAQNREAELVQMMVEKAAPIMGNMMMRLAGDILGEAQSED